MYPGIACFISGSAVDPKVLVVWDYIFSSILSEIHVTSCIPDVLVLLVVVLWTPGWLWFMDYFIFFYSQRNSCDLLYLDIALLSRCLLVFGIWDGIVHVTYCISGLVAALFNAKNSDSGCLLGLALLYPLLFAVKFMQPLVSLVIRSI